MSLFPLITHDPASGREFIVTRLMCPESGVVVEGHFSLGWIGKLTPEQLDFVGLLLKYRNNLQRLAAELGVAYNTARSRLDDIEAALAGEPMPRRTSAARARAASDVLDRLEAGEIDADEALEELREGR